VKSLARVKSVADLFASKGIAHKLVYITEAHPKDGWMHAVAPAKFRHVAYANSVQDRLRTARQFAELCGVDPRDVIVDGIQDTLERAYEARPERLYVVGDGGKVLWRCGPGPWEYDVNGLQKFLQEHA